MKPDRAFNSELRAQFRCFWQRDFDILRWEIRSSAADQD